ncbi:OLC1v1025333C16 [Oldenlandia corymbosa var. corymbosa]|uniref:OLC1v1025333C16 n=1 Tax=Oldenlandia corymbosa var. corymbosa TaxID=529605 RepID=A0AAV1C669_OLDCO|nr:OLC1v1025333C16 [Oldenlandia corymbosa var. corymbosa]
MNKTEIDKFYQPAFCRHLYMRKNLALVKIHPIFLKTHIKEEVPVFSTLKGPSGGSWPVKVHQTEKGIYLVEGWEQFLQDHSLVHGEFLIFSYCGNWCFDVEIFGRDGLQMKIPDGEEEDKAVPSDSKGKTVMHDAKPGTKVSWKRAHLVEFFLDKCKEEVVLTRTDGGNLSRLSWKRIQLAFKEEKGTDFTMVQLENRWHFLKRKHELFSGIIAQVRDVQYDPVANKISWNEKQWEEYVQV